MKKRIICLVLTIVMIFGMVSILAACGPEKPKDCETCVDANEDGKCDVCNKPVKKEECEHIDENGDELCDKCSHYLGDDSEEAIEYPWDDASIVFQMTHNSSGQSLPSGCERYMAGEDLSAVSSIDTMVTDRNTNAYIDTKVSLTYRYYDDVSAHGWAQNITIIYETIYYNASGAPDLYCNFNYDMMAVSLKGVFANLLSTKYKNAESGENLNYFEFDDPDYVEAVKENLEENDRGYMYEFTWSTTLSKNKVYLLASDYFIDMVRAFFVVPVNVALLEEGTMLEDFVGDRDEDGEYTLNDFYLMVENNEWTYGMMEKFCEAIYQPYSESQSGMSLYDRLGFVVSDSGLPASGLVYTTNITIVAREYDEVSQDYKYWYPETSPRLNDLSKALYELFNTTGVLYYTKSTNPECVNFGDTSHVVIRTRFCDNMMLFGGAIMLGALEYSAYQDLKKSSGFGVVPIPLYHEIEEGSDETYLTTIHTIGRVGAIAYNTDVFAQCTAFLNYQSTHSTDILTEYYDVQLQYNIAGGNKNKGTVRILQFIRKNVRSSFDKNMEDAIGVQYDANSARWHQILVANRYQVEDFSVYYEMYYKDKEENLKKLVQQYYTLPS